MDNNPLQTAGVHHLRLTVTDVERARAFYTEVLDFEVAMEIPPGVLLGNGGVFLGLGPPPDPARAIPGDRFDENRVGLDHLSFSVTDYEQLEQAARRFDEKGVPHGEIKDLGPVLGIPIYVLTVRDPDNIQVELTAPHSDT